jgi:hypothetical protein
MSQYTSFFAKNIPKIVVQTNKLGLKYGGNTLNTSYCFSDTKIRVLEYIVKRSIKKQLYFASRN